MKWFTKNARKLIQTLWAVITNSYFKGFAIGKIYSGPLKKFCVPGMNCYSCPGAVGACPIGSLQASFTGRRLRFPFYVLGFLAFIGILVGRFICGWLCVFGLIQELLYMIPTPKIKIPRSVDKVLRYLKYAILLILVILLPIFLRDKAGLSAPYFCKWLCPVGTLEGGVLLVLVNEKLRSAVGFLYAWKLIILAIVILASVFIHRPFCKYMCPLGAFYGLFQKISFLRLAFDESKCVDCGACAQNCGMDVDPRKSCNSAECIRCGECVKACPQKALKFTMKSAKPSR